MPTRERKAKEKARKAEQERMHALFAKAPDLTKFFSVSNDLDCGDGAHGLKGGLISGTEDGDIVLHPAIGTGGNRLRHLARKARILKLQQKYNGKWKRGGAKAIATDEGLDKRTVQKYIKEFPLIARRKK